MKEEKDGYLYLLIKLGLASLPTHSGDFNRDLLIASGLVT